MRFLTLIVVLVMGGVTVPAGADPLEDAVTAAEKGDYATALRLWRPLAEQGSSAAQFNLGLLYDNGRGVPQDYATAASWYQKAAGQGEAVAQFNLGSMYTNGKGVPQDYVAAMSWYRKAAEQGDRQAQHNLGLMYVNGQGVPQDYVQAHMWFNLAASRFVASEKEKRDRAAIARDQVAAKMTPAQIAEAQKLAREWRPK